MGLSTNAVGEWLDNWSLRKRYYNALEAAGLRKVRFHDLRHAFGSMAIRKLDPHTRADLHAARALLHDAALPASPAPSRARAAALGGVP